MGNKDARRREIKKPKKKVPKLAPPRREVDRITTNITPNPTQPK
jgi:hypothetical protein